MAPHPAALHTVLYSLSVDLVFLLNGGSWSVLPLLYVWDRVTSECCCAVDLSHGVGGGCAKTRPQARGASGPHAASRGEMAPKAVSGIGSPGCTGRGSWLAKSQGTGVARPGRRPMPAAVWLRAGYLTSLYPAVPSSWKCSSTSEDPCSVHGFCIGGKQPGW